MYRVESHKNVHRFTELLYRVGIWNRNDEETVGERRLKIFYSIYFAFFLISIAVGAVENDEKDEKIFSVMVTLACVVSQTKLLHLIWKKKEILEHFDRICNYDNDDLKTDPTVNDKLTTFTKFAVFFLSSTYFTASSILFVAPFVGTERKLFIPKGFPMDWKNSEFGYWTAFLFTVTESAVGMMSVPFSVFVWYLIANCSWRYEVLGLKIKKMGEIAVDKHRISVKNKGEIAVDEHKISKEERNNLYNRDLVGAITSYNTLKDVTNQLIGFFSKMFMVQLATSGLSICISIYSLTFIKGDNLAELLIYLGALTYSTFDIFMILYFGNKITLTSGRLSCNLYESDWIDRSQSIKKNVIIFGEILMQPHQLMILKIYPLTLETFTRILNSAYSMFNILKNFK